MRDILLHCCCAPCTIMPLRRLSEEGHSPTCLFYNPNIHPYTEFAKRIDALKILGFDTGADIIIDDRYGLDVFLTMVFDKVHRCSLCYGMRMREAARVCVELGLSRFTTTLLHSKRQKHDQVVRASRKAAEEFGIEFVYIDFRTSWKEGVGESKRMGLYRQQYCGCIFSEQERYVGGGDKSNPALARAVAQSE